MTAYAISAKAVTTLTERIEDMPSIKTKHAAQKGGDNMQCNYAINGSSIGQRPIYVHEYGDYLSFSDEQGDYLMAVCFLAPYSLRERYFTGEEVPAGDPVILKSKETKTVVERNLDGTYTRREVFTGGESVPYMYQPMEKVYAYRDATPAFTKYGKPIKAGDQVKVQPAGQGLITGELTEVHATHFVITTDKGKHFIPWNRTDADHRVTRA